MQKHDQCSVWRKYARNVPCWQFAPYCCDDNIQTQPSRSCTIWGLHHGYPKIPQRFVIFIFGLATSMGYPQSVSSAWTASAQAGSLLCLFLGYWVERSACESWFNQALASTQIKWRQIVLLVLVCHSRPFARGVYSNSYPWDRPYTWGTGTGSLLCIWSELLEIYKASRLSMLQALQDPNKSLIPSPNCAPN